MKTKLTVIFLSIIFLTGIESYCQNPTVKNDSLKVLLENSKTNKKNLFLIFGWEGCGWCRLFDKYHSDPKVKEILSKYFLIAYMDIYKSKTGKDLFKEYGKGGTPSWTIFDINGHILIDSDNGKGNVGYPAKEEELDHYVLALKKSAPNLPNSESDFLISKLKDYRNSKEQNK